MINNRQIFWHTLFWLCLILFFMYLASANEKLTFNALLIIFLLYPLINIGLFYFNYLFLIPRFFKNSQYDKYCGIILIIIFVLGAGKYGIAFLYKDVVLAHVASFTSYFFSTVLTSLLFIFLSFSLKFAIDWFSKKTAYPNPDSLKLDAEISLIGSQTNPHFLFNSLNSIYSLAYQRSENTPGVILNLSRMMRYTAYDCNENKIQLSEELEYLQSYVDLQKLRLGEKAYIEFKIDGQIGSQEITPMLLIPFIENAIKHGVTNDPLSPIILKIKLEDNRLDLYTQNKKHTYNRDAFKGIGNNDAKSRLDLLYRGKYNLNINDGSEIYTCELSLIL